MRGYTLSSMVGPVLICSLAAPTCAWAESFGVIKEGRQSSRNYANFRFGATSATDRAEMCLEVSPHKRFGFEACGTGATWFHSDSSLQFMHLRGHFQVASFHTSMGWVQPRIGVGVAELQIGEDAGGLYFGGTGPKGVETAGPEIDVSVRMVSPIWGGIELVSQLDFTAAYLPHAPNLIVPQSKLQPQVTATLGFGF